MESANHHDLGRLRWRCRRGMKELDRLLVAWLDRHGATASAPELDRFVRLLDAEDPDLWHWVTGRRAPADPELEALVGQIRAEYRP
jgi:antitoxin CptB